MAVDSNAETGKPHHENSPKTGAEPLQKTVSRREFLKKTAKYMGGLATLAAASRYPDIRDTVRTHKDREELSSQIAANEAYLKERYGLTVETKLSDSQLAEGWLQIDLQLSEKADILQWTRREISKYPPEYFNNFLKTHAIRILKGYIRPGQSIGEGGAVLWELDTKTGKSANEILITKEVGLGWLDSKLFPTTFHHELRHLADSQIINSDEQNKWVNLNSNGPRAYTGRKVFNELVGLVKRPEGFAEAYGKTNMLEDRATAASLLLTDPNKARELSQNDQVLALKFEKVKEDYFRASGGKMDEQYWIDLAGGKVNENYWNNKTSQNIQK